MKKITGAIYILIGLCFIALGALQFVPQLQSEGYVKWNKVTGEVLETKGNFVTEFTSDYLGDELVEKNQTFNLILPVTEEEFKAKASKVEVNVDGSFFSCAPKTPAPTPTPEPTPTPAPTPQPLPTDPNKYSWGIRYTHVEEAHSIAQGAGLTVCVLDTGVFDQHPDLKGRIVRKLSTVGDDGTDRFGHGTHVIGTIAGPKKIGASVANIISIKVLDDTGSGSTQQIISGAQTCANLGANIVSMSLGSDSGSTMFKQMVESLSSKGIWVIMAGGNNGSARFGYPAAYAANVPKAIAVVATMATGGKAIFSQYQPGFPIDNVKGAPGTAILSTVPVGGCSLCGANRTGYMEMSGTSMATPLVAGITALMISAQKQKLLGNASNDPNAGTIIDALKTVTGN